VILFIQEIGTDTLFVPLVTTPQDERRFRRFGAASNENTVGGVTVKSTDGGSVATAGCISRLDSLALIGADCTLIEHSSRHRMVSARLM
jgi:hypothetical protein